jgi:hypothetical protein
MEIQLTLVTGKTARADLKSGVLHVRMPRHWPRSEKEAAIDRFRRWAIRRARDMAQLPPPVHRRPMTEGELWDLVRLLNAETLRVDVAGVRIGRARFSRLAQANWQTRILTFSRLALCALPDRALRYLILHELAHLRIPNHSPEFWALVEAFEPDWRHWRKVAQNHFVRAAEFGGTGGSDLTYANPSPGRSAVAQRPEPQFFIQENEQDLDAIEQEKAGDIAAQALFDDLTGPHGMQMALFAELAPEYHV